MISKFLKSMEYILWIQFSNKIIHNFESFFFNSDHWQIEKSVQNFQRFQFALRKKRTYIQREKWKRRNLQTFPEIYYVFFLPSKKSRETTEITNWLFFYLIGIQTTSLIYVVKKTIQIVFSMWEWKFFDQIVSHGDHAIQINIFIPAFRLKRRKISSHYLENH